MRMKLEQIGAVILMAVSCATAGAWAEEHKPASPANRSFLVLLGLGPNYDSSLPVTQQKAFPAHAAYVKELESKGLLIFGGPLVDGFEGLHATGGVLVVRAATSDEARKLVAADPSGMLAVQDVRPMVVSVGAK